MFTLTEAAIITFEESEGMFEIWKTAPIFIRGYDPVFYFWYEREFVRRRYTVWIICIFCNWVVNLVFAIDQYLNERKISREVSDKKCPFILFQLPTGLWREELSLLNGCVLNSWAFLRTRSKLPIINSWKDKHNMRNRRNFGQSSWHSNVSRKWNIWRGKQLERRRHTELWDTS